MKQKGYSLLRKALIYHEKNKNSQHIGKSRDDFEGQGWCQTITTGCNAVFTEGGHRGLLKGINA